MSGRKLAAALTLLGWAALVAAGVLRCEGCKGTGGGEDGPAITPDQ